MPHPSDLTRRAFLAVTLLQSACGGGAAAEDEQPAAASDAPPQADSEAPPPPAAVARPLRAAPAVELTRLTLLTAAGGIWPWCAGHAFAPGDLPPGSELDGVQLTVKSTWPDGSVKIGVLASISESADTRHVVPLGVGHAPSGAPLTPADLKATGVTASIETDRYGSATWRDSDWDEPFLAWVSGAVMSSWIYRKPVGDDDHLTAWLEVRLWNSGHVEILPWIENGYLFVDNPSDRPGTYVFALNARELFRQSLPVWHHTRAPLLAGGTLSYWHGGTAAVAPRHDADYLARTGLVQAYMAEAAKPEWAASPSHNGVPVEFQPYQKIEPTNSLHSPAMGMPGGHWSIGVQPAWEAIALTVSSARAFEQLLRESYRFGQYHVHYRDEHTNRPLRFSAHPGAAMSSSANADQLGYKDVQAGGAQIVPTGTGAYGMRWSVSHQPASPLLAYLLTGRYWFVEECQFVSTANYLSVPAQRQGSRFIVRTGYQQMRSAAWMIRDLFNAACATPDDDPLKAEFDAAVAANVEFAHARMNNPFGLWETGLRRRGDFGGAQAWQYDFWTGAWGKAIAMRLGRTMSTRRKAREFFDWTSRSVVGRLGSTGQDEFLYRYATGQGSGGNRVPFLWPGAGITMAADGVTVTGTAPDYERGTGPWFANWGEIYRRTIIEQDGNTDRADGNLGGGFWLDPTGWWGNLMNAAMAVAALDAPGARDAVARMRNAPNWNAWVQALTAGGKPPTNALTDANLRIERFEPVAAGTMALPAAGERLNINLNSASDVDFDFQRNGSQAGPYERWWNGYGLYRSWTQMVGAWSGAVWAPEYGGMGATICYGGGHGGNQGQFAYVFDIASRRWSQVGAPRNLPDNLEWAGFASPTAPTYTAALDRRDSQWRDFDFGGSRIKLIDHTYNTVAYVPESLGGGQGGALLVPQAPLTQNPSEAPGIWAPHLLSLADGRMTRAMSAPPGLSFNDNNQTVVVRDTRRGRLWYFRQGSTTCWYHDLTAGPPYRLVPHVIQRTGGGTTTQFVIGLQATYEYCPEADAILAFKGPDVPALNGEVVFRVYDMRSGVPVAIERTDLPRMPFFHGGASPSATWCPPEQAFYLYEGMGDDFCYVLRPSTLDFANCDWNWSREQFEGPEPVTRFPGMGLMTTLHASFRRFQWAESLGCFLWHDGPTTRAVCSDGVLRDGIVQAWQPPGRVI